MTTPLLTSFDHALGVVEDVMKKDSERIAAVFCVIADLAAALGVKSISEREGCWEHTLDERWWFAINGHNGPTPCSHGVDVPPFHCYVEYNGWPAGMFSPYGGQMAAGSSANEDTLLIALRGALLRATA